MSKRLIIASFVIGMISLATYWWPAVYAVPMDDETGQFWGGSMHNMGQVAPAVTRLQMEALNSYAAVNGLWAI